MFSSLNQDVTSSNPPVPAAVLTLVQDLKRIYVLTPFVYPSCTLFIDKPATPAYLAAAIADWAGGET
jgi:hypothetical protein